MIYKTFFIIGKLLLQVDHELHEDATGPFRSRWKQIHNYQKKEDKKQTVAIIPRSICVYVLLYVDLVLVEVDHLFRFFYMHLKSL